MTLTLRIDNISHLPDGGPVEYSVNQGGFEFGRDPGMDWTLPDPNRFVSSCHGEVRFDNGLYWLVDVSTNGTFVNGASARVKSPYQLQNGDRLQIGHYVVVVDTGAAAAPKPDPFSSQSAPAPAPSGGGGGGNIWDIGGGGGGGGGDDFDPTPRPEGRMSDFGDQHIDLPDFGGGTGAPPPPDAGSPFGNQSADAGSPFGGGAAQAPSPTPGSDSPFGDPTPPALEPAADAGSPFASQPPTPQPTPAPVAGTDAGSPFASTPPTPQPTPPEPAPAPAHPLAPETAPAPVAPPAPAATPAPAPAPAAEAFAPPPPTAPAPEPAAPPPAEGKTTEATDFIKAICDGANMPANAFDGADPGQVAHQIGQALRIMATEMAGLLRARQAAKQMVRAGSRTMLGREANNPLKFIPTAEEALETMFGAGRPGYMGGAETVQSSFNDIQAHQFAMHAALQPALRRMIEDLAPEGIEARADAGRFGSKGAEAWKIFTERWDAMTSPYDNGMLDVFLAYFAEAYDDAMQKQQPGGPS